MAEKSAARSDLTVPPTDVEVKTFEKVMDMLNAYRKTHLIMAALKLGVFSALRGSKLSAEEVGRRCKAHESRKLDSMLDLLCVEDLLVREKGEDGTMVYGNAEGAEKLLSDPSSPTHAPFIDLVLMEGTGEMTKWQHLSETLQVAPGEEKGGVDGNVEKDTPDQKEEKVDAQSSDSEQFQVSAEMYNMFERFMRIAFNLLAERFDFSKCKRILDIGGGTAQLSRILCRRYKHLECISIDLPEVQPFAVARMKEVGADVAERISLQSGNCLEDDLPAPVDAVIFANVLHTFETTEMQAQAIRRAYEALSPGGSLIVVADFIDVERKYDSGMYGQIGVEITPAGGPNDRKMAEIFTTESFKVLCEAAGFRMADHIQLAITMMSAAVAVKP